MMVRPLSVTSRTISASVGGLVFCFGLGFCCEHVF